MAEGQVSSASWCVFYGAGIIGTLVLYGILQEGIMTVAYDGNLFQYSVFLVLCNRLAAVMFAVCMAASKGESMRNAAPLWKYLVVSLSNVYASSCQYEALKYVSFAVQMLGKSFKMMPVMIWGIIIAGKAYSGRDWLVALAVTLGCTEFLMTGPTHSKLDAGNSFKGFLLLGCFLALDGLTSTFQEKLFKEHKTTKYNQMLYINGLSATVSLVTLLATGGGRSFQPHAPITSPGLSECERRNPADTPTAAESLEQENPQTISDLKTACICKSDKRQARNYDPQASHPRPDDTRPVHASSCLWLRSSPVLARLRPAQWLGGRQPILHLLAASGPR